jgi:hypothetical protein
MGLSVIELDNQKAINEITGVLNDLLKNENE